MLKYTGALSGFGKMLHGDVDLDTMTLVFVLVDSADYTFSAAHTTLADVPAGARVATSPSVTPGFSGTTVTQPGFTFTLVSGDPFEVIVVCIRSAAGDANHFLWFMIEDADETELPMTPNGQDIIVAAGNLITI